SARRTKSRPEKGSRPMNEARGSGFPAATLLLPSLEPPAPRGPGKRIGPEIGDHPLPAGPRAPWSDAVQRQPMDQVRLARAGMDGHAAAPLEALAPRRHVGFREILLGPALER